MRIDERIIAEDGTIEIGVGETFRPGVVGEIETEDGIQTGT